MTDHNYNKDETNHEHGDVHNHDAQASETSSHETSSHETSSHETEAKNTENTVKDTADVIIEEFKVTGEAVVSKVKEIVREGNVRRIIIKNDTGKTLLEIPLTLGVVGALLLPQIAVLGTLGALIANLTLAVERETSKDNTVVVEVDAEETHRADSADNSGSTNY